MYFVTPVIGILVFLFSVYALSRNRKGISYRFVAIGMAAQFVVAIVLLKVPLISDLLMKFNDVVGVLKTASDKSAQFMLGYLAGGPAPFEMAQPGNAYIVAFRVLPMILIITTLSALLFHFGILGWIIGLLSRALRRFLPISGPVGFSAAATVFVGTIETPLVVRPYLAKMKESDLLMVLTSSMATISGTVMILYASVLDKILPNALTHMLVASMINVPASLVVSHLFLPSPPSGKGKDIQLEKSKLTWIEVLLEAVQDGVKMIISIVAIIIVMFAFIHLFDGILSLFNPNLTLAAILSQVLRPVMWLVGFPWEKAGVAAELMGTKIVLNEFVAFLKLSDLTIFNPRETLILVYCMCGFANLASSGIIIAGLTAILPERRQEIVRLTFISLFLGNIATLLTGCVAGLLSAF